MCVLWRQKNFTAALDFHRHALNHTSRSLRDAPKLGNGKHSDDGIGLNFPQLSKHWRSISSCYIRFSLRTVSKPPDSVPNPPPPPPLPLMNACCRCFSQDGT